MSNLKIQIEELKKLKALLSKKKNLSFLIKQYNNFKKINFIKTEEKFLKEKRTIFKSSLISGVVNKPKIINCLSLNDIKNNFLDLSYKIEEQTSFMNLIDFILEISKENNNIYYCESNKHFISNVQNYFNNISKENKEIENIINKTTSLISLILSIMDEENDIEELEELNNLLPEIMELIVENES